MPPTLPRPRSQLPVLTDFTLPLANTDEFYFSGELWDPIARRPVPNSFGPPPTLAKRSRKMPPAPQRVEPPRSSQEDQLASDDAPPLPRLEHFRYVAPRDDTVPAKRQRPSKCDAPLPRSTTDLRENGDDLDDDKEHSVNKRKKKKEKERAKESQAIVLRFGEVDEDGNPVDPPPPSASPSPPRPRERTPFHPVSPTKRSSSRVFEDAPRLSPSPTNPSPSRARTLSTHVVTASVPCCDTAMLEHDQENPAPSSSQSFVLPSQIVERIKSSHEADPAPSFASHRPEVFDDVDDTLVDAEAKLENLGSGTTSFTQQMKRLSEAEKSQVEEIIHGLEDDGFGGFDIETDSDDRLAELEGAKSQADGNKVDAESNADEPSTRDTFQTQSQVISTSSRTFRSHSSANPERLLHVSRACSSHGPSPPPAVARFECPPEFLPSTTQDIEEKLSTPNRQSTSVDREPSTSKSDPVVGTSSSNRRTPFITSSAQFMPPPSWTEVRKPTPTHRLVALTVGGLTSLVQEFVETALNSSEPLSRFGLADPSDTASTSTSREDGFGRGEVGYLRREVNRLTSEVVDKERTILALSDRLGAEARNHARVREELDGLEAVVREVEIERDRERERVGWMKEAKKGLVRELRELEQRCEELEREKQERSEGACARD
ncbi:hypothetical protein JCM11491_005509 [Sporobolomyces phaffii]